MLPNWLPQEHIRKYRLENESTITRTFKRKFLKKVFFYGRGISRNLLILNFILPDNDNNCYND